MARSRQVREVNNRFIPGVRVYATRMTPSASNFAGQTIPGIRFLITDRESFDSTRLGLELAAALRDLFPGHIDFDKCRRLIGSSELIKDLKEGRDASALWTKAQQQASPFIERRKSFLLY